MNNDSAGLLELEMQKYFSRFSKANKEQKRTPSEENEKQICLTSRSAFGALYNWAVLHDELSNEVNQQLRNLFEEAIRVMPVDSVYRESVAGRFADFETLCSRVKEGLEPASLSSISY